MMAKWSNNNRELKARAPDAAKTLEVNIEFHRRGSLSGSVQWGRDKRDKMRRQMSLGANLKGRSVPAATLIMRRARKK